MGDKLNNVYNKIYNKYIYYTSKREIKYYIIILVSILIDTDDGSWTRVNNIYNKVCDKYIYYSNKRTKDIIL